MIQELEEECNIGELEWGIPAALVVLDLVVNDHEEGDKQVCSDQTSETDEGLLTNANPWRVADTKKDGL